VEHGCDEGDSGLLPPRSREKGHEPVQDEYGEEVASSGDDNASNNVVLGRAFRSAGDGYDCVNASSLR
jgi:hypothetical protein